MAHRLITVVTILIGCAAIRDQVFTGGDRSGFASAIKLRHNTIMGLRSLQNTQNNLANAQAQRYVHGIFDELDRLEANMFQQSEHEPAATALSQAQYDVSALGASICPSGFTYIIDLQTCKDSGVFLGFTDCTDYMGGHHGSSATIGCVVNMNNQCIHFNVDNLNVNTPVAGQSFAKYVCQRHQASSAATESGPAAPSDFHERWLAAEELYPDVWRDKLCDPAVIDAQARKFAANQSLALGGSHSEGSQAIEFCGKLTEKLRAKASVIGNFPRCAARLPQEIALNISQSNPKTNDCWLTPLSRDGFLKSWELYQQDSVILVLGQGLNPDGSSPPTNQRRAAEAATIFWNQRVPVIVSGGDDRATGLTEAMPLALGIEAAGVPPEAIIYEGQATTTLENFWFGFRQIRRYMEFPSRPKCPLSCLSPTCNTGKSKPEGLELADGKCTKYCSSLPVNRTQSFMGRVCGEGAAYRQGEYVDCNGCAEDGPFANLKLSLVTSDWHMSRASYFAKVVAYYFQNIERRSGVPPFFQDLPIEIEAVSVRSVCTHAESRAGSSVTGSNTASWIDKCKGEYSALTKHEAGPERYSVGDDSIDSNVWGVELNPLLPLLESHKAEMKSMLDYVQANDCSAPPDP